METNKCQSVLDRLLSIFRPSEADLRPRPGLPMLESLDEEVRRVRLVRRYYTRQGHLHGDRFYAGLYDPLEETERRIRQTTVSRAVMSKRAPQNRTLRCTTEEATALSTHLLQLSQPATVE